MTDGRSTSGALAIPAIASGGAAIIHATAAGANVDDAGLARLFLILALLQGGAAIHALLDGGRVAAGLVVGVNLAAAAGWLVTRLVDVPWVGGLEVAARPAIADTVAAVLALVAVTGAGAVSAGGSATAPPQAIGSATLLVGVLVVPGLAAALSHDHDDLADHADHAALAPGEAHDHSVVATPTAAGSGDASTASGDGDGDHSDHDHSDHDHSDDDHSGHDHTAIEDALSAAASEFWPRPWDPTAPIDFSGVPGVTIEQRARAEALVADTLRELPRFADVTRVPELGYHSIGDAATGFEHYINTDLIVDDRLLDPTAPESLVYQVDGDDRTLVSAMFIAADTPIDDPSLTDYAGPLMQWHVHENLCWGLDAQGQPVVKGVTDGAGDCPPGTVKAGGGNPMVHVWIAPHECGPFAALEGHGAGQASVGEGARVDLCAHGDHHDHDDPAGGAIGQTTPYHPDLPIDLGGVPGVSPQQQAFAENLVAATVRDLPRWQDLDAVEAAGFRSIGDGASGHEHYIQWAWIDDDIVLDPDFPESLVFEPQPDGSKRLVSAMYMLPSDTPLDDVPDWGGPLMQWHVHGDLCFTDDPDAPQVAGVKPVGTPCRPPLVDAPPAPMIHVWVTPHECGPFAALDGIGGGQVPDGEDVLCDSAHGAH